MGATLIGVLAIVLAIGALVVWGMIALLGLTQALAILFILTCILMMLVILIQKPKGGGLSGAFGGAGGGQQAAFGAKTGDVLTVVTVGFFLAFLGLAMGLTWASHAELDALAQPQETEQVDDSATTPPPPGVLQSEIPVVPPVEGGADAPATSDMPQPAATPDTPDATTSQSGGDEPAPESQP